MESSAKITPDLAAEVDAAESSNLLDVVVELAGDEPEAADMAAAKEAFARAAEPVAERDGVITVACDSAVWAQELDLLSERVVEALNGAIGRPAVRRLRPRALPARY